MRKSVWSASRWLAAVSIAGAVFCAQPAQASIVERVVAVVGDQPILLSELRYRARQPTMRILASTPAAMQQSAITEMYKELLMGMVEERLVTTEADAEKISVTSVQVDAAVNTKAESFHLSLPDFFTELRKGGLSESDYRDQVRRELLFGKMIESKASKLPHPSDDDALDYYKRLLVRERSQMPYKCAIIRLAMTANDGGKSTKLLARKLVLQARSGADFAELAKQFSVDPSAASGGDLGTRRPGSFANALDEVLLHLDINQVTEPMSIGNQLVILKVTARPQSQLDTFEKMKPRLIEAVFMESFAKVKQQFISELKEKIWFEIRL
jgi:peptidyl-prolyl cis-trans isomerase SurA